MERNSLLCADVPLRNYSLTQHLREVLKALTPWVITVKSADLGKIDENVEGIFD